MLSERLKDFNTSNVTIQPEPGAIHRADKEHFNTSNVTIQHTYLKIRVPVRFISIHIMLLFNKPVYAAISYLGHFNTSNVTIQRNIDK